MSSYWNEADKEFDAWLDTINKTYKRGMIWIIAWWIATMTTTIVFRNLWFMMGLAVMVLGLRVLHVVGDRKIAEHKRKIDSMKMKWLKGEWR